MSKFDENLGKALNGDTRPDPGKVDEMREKAAILNDVSHSTTDSCGAGRCQFLYIENNRPSIRADQSHNQPQDRRFARSAGTNERRSAVGGKRDTQRTNRGRIIK